MGWERLAAYAGFNRRGMEGGMCFEGKGARSGGGEKRWRLRASRRRGVEDEEWWFRRSYV